MFFRASLRKLGGYSLIELLVVLVIMGLLVGLVGPRLFSRVDSSKVETAETQVRMLKAAMQTFRLDMGRYPTTDEGLKALSINSASSERWNGPYLEEELPLDPWGNPYALISPGGLGVVDIFSNGPDGEPGTDDDIGNWNINEYLN